MINYNNLALGKTTVAARPIQIGYIRLPLGYHNGEKPAASIALSVATISRRKMDDVPSRNVYENKAA